MSPGTSIPLVLGSTVPLDAYRLCVSLLLSVPPSNVQHPGPLWCQTVLPALVGLVGEGAGYLTLLPVSCGRHLAWGPQWPRTLRRSQLPHCPSAISSPCFSMSSTLFGLQPSYKLGFCWLFTLFLRKWARCSVWAQGELGSAPTYPASIFLDLNLKSLKQCNYGCYL